MTKKEIRIERLDDDKKKSHMSDKCKCGHSNDLHWKIVYCSPAQTGCHFNSCPCGKFES